MNTEKIYDLEERTLVAARNVRDFCRNVDLNLINREYIKQVIRSSSSPGANYIEANENLGEKDFLMKIKTCRRESKETIYWLKLLLIADEDIESKNLRSANIQEYKELVLIFSAIIKNKNNNQT